MCNISHVKNAGRAITYIPNIPLKRPCPGASIGPFTFFFLLLVLQVSIFQYWKKRFVILRFRVGGPFSRRQFRPRIWRAPRVPGGKFIYFYFYLFIQKLIELWAKNRILNADLFAFDRDAHRYDCKLVGGKRLVSSILQDSFVI